MKKNMLAAITAFFILTLVKAQAYKSNLNFQKNQYSVAAIQVPYEEDVVEDAIKDYMSGRGFKEAHYKDFIIYRSVPINADGSLSTDAYFNIKQKSHSEKDVTIVSLLPVKKGETLTPANAEDSSFVRLSVAYLDSMRYNILSYSLKQQVQAQQKTVDKIKSKMLDLKNDSGDIAKKIRSYESDLQQNKKDQEKQAREISGIASGNESALAKAHKKMDKLMDNQADYEKKLRNYKADLDRNIQDRETEQSLLDKANQQLEALKKRLENLK